MESNNQPGRFEARLAGIASTALTIADECSDDLERYRHGCPPNQSDHFWELFTVLDAALAVARQARHFLSAVLRRRLSRLLEQLAAALRQLRALLAAPQVVVAHPQIAGAAPALDPRRQPVAAHAPPAPHPLG